MQVNRNCSNLGQLYMQVRYWILLELGEQQRFHLPVLLESGKAKASFLKIFPTSMQLLDGLLKHLRRNFTQFREFFLRSWQVVKLLNFAWEFQTRRKDIFLLQGASINQALTTTAPIFYLPQCIVKCTTTNFHPLNQYLFLSDIGIDSIAVSHCQHLFSIKDLLVRGTGLNVKTEGIEPPLLTAFYLPLNCRGYSPFGSI